MQAHTIYGDMNYEKHIRPKEFVIFLWCERGCDQKLVSHINVRVIHGTGTWATGIAGQEVKKRNLIIGMFNFIRSENSGVVQCFFYLAVGLFLSSRRS